MPTIFFQSEGHKTRFLTVIRRIGKVYAGKLDPEYAAAVYVLSSDLGTWERAESYVSRRGILFEKLLEQVDFSSGYRALIMVAADLFNEQWSEHSLHASLVDVACTLDEPNFRVAMNAFKLRRYNLPISQFEEGVQPCEGKPHQTL